MSTIDESLEPFADGFAHLDAELARLDLLCRLRLRAFRAERGAPAEAFHGLYVPDEEVDRLLAPATDGSVQTAVDDRPQGDSGAGRDGSETIAERLESATRRLRRRARLTVERTGNSDSRLATLADRLGLHRRELDALVVALAPALDAKYERVYSYLQDDVSRTRPTVQLILELLAGTRRGRLEARTVFASEGSLRRYGLVRLGGDDARMLTARTVTVDERVVAFLLGDDAVDTTVADIVSVHAPRGRSTGAIPEGFADRLTAVADRLATGRTDMGSGESESGSDLGDARSPAFVHVYGPYGSGTAEAAALVCRKLSSGSSLVRVDLGAACLDAAGGSLASLLRLVEREALLRDAAVHAVVDERDNDGETEDRDWGRGQGRLASLVAELDGLGTDVYLTGRRRLPAGARIRVRKHELVSLELETPAYDRRLERWQRRQLPDDVNPADLASKFRFTGGQIDDAVTTAATLARAAGRETVSRADVYKACRMQCGDRLDRLARKLDPTYRWADIVLPEDVIAHLREVEAHIVHHDRVYTDWGFEGRFSLVDGVTALFSGPSGTGKTMAAEVLARETGLDVFKIDLSRVVDKYVGETESNLRRVFDEAEGSNAILLFDEADALFGKRAEVKDARDRYANLEVNYLLQRIEEYGGIVLLTTNFEGNVDDAFLRRITHSVEFPLPDRTARTTIWRGVFPDEMPIGDLDVEFLAGLELTGGNIRNVAVNAAFLAAAEDSCVEMCHVLGALRREFRKTGRLIDPDEFGRYYEFVQGAS